MELDINKGLSTKHNVDNGGSSEQLESFSVLAKVKVRCPSCTKLYVVNASEIKSSSPHFLCHVCHSKFTFDYPAASEFAEARLVGTIAIANEPQVVPFKAALKEISLAEKRHLKPCPKCGGKNALNATECSHCQVILAKVQDLVPAEAGVRALPSLVRKWQDVLSDFDNEVLHRQFLEECRAAQALPYAMYRYRQMLEVQPQDNMALKMLARAQTLEMGEGANQSLPGFGKGLKQINWLEVLYWVPAVVSAILFLAGMSNRGMRNYIGFSSAVTVLWAGMSYYFNGKIGYVKSKE